MFIGKILAHGEASRPNLNVKSSIMGNSCTAMASSEFHTTTKDKFILITLHPAGNL